MPFSLRSSVEPAVEETRLVALDPSQVPDGRPRMKLEPGKHYLTVTLRSLRVFSKKGMYSYHAVVHSYASLPQFGMPDGMAHFHKVAAPDRLKDLDPDHVDRVMSLNVPLLGPVPYRGGRLEWQIGLMAVKSANLAAPYLTLLEKLSSVAGVSFIKAAQPFVEPIREGIELLTGTAGSATLQAGLYTAFGPPETGWYLIARSTDDAVAEPKQLRLSPHDLRLVGADGRRVGDFSYMVVSVEAHDRRTDLPLIPDLRETYADLQVARRKGKDSDIEQALEDFKRACHASPDLLPADATRFIDEVSELVLGSDDSPARLTAGEDGDLPDISALAVARPTATYNRAQALAYARKYWTLACSDNAVAVKANPYYKAVPPGTPFVQEVSGGQFQTEWAQPTGQPKIPLADLEDCTHFISCCLGSEPNEAGGGLPIKQDFTTIYGRLSAQRLFDDLKGDNVIAIVGTERMSFAAAAPLLSQLQAGDLIFYYAQATGRYGHTGLYLADTKKRIACHTYCRCDVHDRYNQAWNSVNLDSVTLARIIV